MQEIIVMLNRIILTLLVAIVLCGIAPSQDRLVGVTWNGRFVDIDASSGTDSLRAFSGLAELNDLAVSPTGRVLTANAGITSGSPRFWALDTEFNTTTFDHSTMVNDIRGMCYDSNGTLYVVDVVGGVSSRLYYYTFPPPPNTDGQPHLIANVTIGTFSVALSAIAFGPNAVLYGWGPGFGLITIDPATGAAVDVDGVTGPTSSIGGLAFRSDGVLFGANNQLFTIDTTTGVATPVAGDFAIGDVRGIGFLPATGSAYCTASSTSLGCVAAMHTAGTPSVSAASGFVVSAGPFPNQRPGGLVYSISGSAQTGLGGGILCVAAPIRMWGTSGTTGGNALPTTDCSGAVAIDFNQYLATALPPAITAGTTIWVQAAVRDSPKVALSDAMRFVIGP